MKKLAANLVGILAVLVWLLPVIVVGLQVGWWIATGGVLFSHLTSAGASFVYASALWLLFMWIPLAGVSAALEE